MRNGRRGDATRTPPSLLGRDAELERLARCAEKARSGAVVSVRLVGAAGMGKTVLVRRFVRALRDFRVAHAVCDPGALCAPHGVVQQLLAGLGHHEQNQTGERPRLVEVVGEVACSAPVVLVVDGANWADRCSAVELAELRRMPGGRPVLLLTTARPSTVDIPWFVAEDVVVRLGPLAPAHVRELAERSGAGALSPVVADEVCRRTGGHPLHTSALLTDVEPDALVDSAAVVAPLRLVRLVRPVVDALPEDSRCLLHALAVLGEEVPPSLAAQVAGVADDAAVWSPLEDGCLVEVRRLDGGAVVGFRYRVERDAVYETVPPTRRRALHTAAVRFARPEDVWAHEVAAANGPDPDLADRLDVAGARAVEDGDPRRGAEYHLWAASLSTEPAAYERRLLSAAENYLHDADQRRARSLRPAVEASTSSPRRSLVLGMLDTTPSVREQHLLQGLAAANAAEGEQDVAARITAVLAEVRLEQGRAADAVEFAEQALAAGRLNRPLSEHTLGVLVRAHLRTDAPPGPAELLDRLLPNGSVESTGAGRVAVLSGAIRVAAGQLASAVADLRAALAVPVAAPTRLADGVSLAHAEYLAGDWEAAQRTVTCVLKEALARDASEVMAVCWSMAAQLSAGRGRWQRAEEQLRAAAEAARLRESRADRGFVAVAAAVVAQARGDHVRMLEALTPVRDGGFDGQDHRWWRRLLFAEALVGAGQWTAAAQAVARLRGASAEMPVLRTPAEWLSGWLATESGDLARARAHFEDGLAAADTAEVPVLVLGRLEQMLARLEHRARRSRRSVELALRARDRYAALDAVPFLERCAADLAGYRPEVGRRRAAGPPWLDRLTERERAVAELVERGLSNDETAGRLRVTRKTVEYHLGHIYDKLGIRSRGELRRRFSDDVR